MVAAPDIPDGWASKSVGTRMTLGLPPYLQNDTLPKDNLFSMFAPYESSDFLTRSYSGPDTLGNDCLVMMTAFHKAQGFSSPEGAINDYVGSLSGFGIEGIHTSKREVQLPIGKAWRGVITFSFGGEALSMIYYAGNASGRYYEVMFMESGKKDVVLVEDDAIMQTLRFL